MNHKSFELWQGATINGRTIEIWHKQSQPGAMTWHLTDFEIRIDGKIVQSFPRSSTTAEIFKNWEKLCGFKNCGYPMLPHCPTGGSPHYKNKAGELFYAPFKGLFEPSIYQRVEGFLHSDIINQGCVV